MEENFKIGDKVFLNSSSPTMTITELHYNYSNPLKVEETKYFNGLVSCTWFENTTLKKIKLHQDTLTKANN